jgi:type IV pilus assembly protein PilV
MISDNFNRSMQAAKSLQSRQRGISLIDAMIALVIFSVGMLALASLQSISKQSNFEAIQRTHAASLAYDLFERMRMNKAALSNYVAAPTITDQTFTSCASGCAPAATAINDLYVWKKMILGDAEVAATGSVGGLVSPTVCITGPGASGHDYTLTIVWRGQAIIANQSASTCGTGTGLYNDPSTGDEYAYRRILELSTYM